MAGPVWFKVRKELGHQPIVAGRITGSTPLFVERYLYQDIERTVSGMDSDGTGRAVRRWSRPGRRAGPMA